MRSVVIAALLLSHAIAVAAPRLPLQSWLDHGRYKEFHRAAEALAVEGDAEASYLLARAYQLGKGVEADEQAASEWYRHAVDGGHAAAVFPYALLLMEHQPYEALRLFERAAAEGLHPDAREKVLAVRIRLCKDHRERASCETAGTALLADWKRSGDDGKLDDAIVMYVVACAIDHHFARNDAEPVPACVRATRLADNGATQGLPRATFNRGALAFQLERYEEAHRWYLQAWARGQAQSGYMLGQLYEHGLGVERNLQEALRWYEQAAGRRDDTARARLARYWMDVIDRSHDPALLRAAIQALDAIAPHGAGAAAEAKRRLNLTARAQQRVSKGRRFAKLPLAPSLCPDGPFAYFGEWRIYAVDSLEEATQDLDELELVANGPAPKRCIELTPADRTALRDALGRGRTLVLWWPSQRFLIDATAARGTLRLTLGGEIL